MTKLGNNSKGLCGEKPGQQEGTLQKALKDINGLIETWKTLKPEAQAKLKLIIDFKISLLQSSEPPLELDCDEKSSYPILEHLHKLGKNLTSVEFKDDAVDDAIMKELDTMIKKTGIPTPAHTKVFHFKTGISPPAPTEQGDPEQVFIPGSSSDRNRYPFTFFRCSGHGILSAELSSKPYFLVYDPDKVNYYVVDVDGNRPDYLDLHYTIDVSGVSGDMFIDQVPESPNVRLTIAPSTGHRSVFYLRMATEEKANAFVKHLKGHPWRKIHLGLIASFDFNKSLAYAEQDLGRAHVDDNKQAVGSRFVKPKAEEPGVNAYFPFVCTCSIMHPFPKIVPGSEFETMYYFDGATNNYSPVLRKRGESNVKNRGRHYSFNANDLEDIRHSFNSCAVDIETKGKGVLCGDIIQVVLQTSINAARFAAHLKRSRSRHSGN